MGGTADAPPPPPPSGHSCSWRELSQRFSWFCLKPLSPPGKRDQADILVTHPKVSDALDPPFFTAHADATRAGADSIVPTTTAITVTDAGHSHQQQGCHESMAHIAFPSTRLMMPRNMSLSNVSVQGLPHLRAHGRRQRRRKKLDKRHFSKTENIAKTTSKQAHSTPEQGGEPAGTVFQLYLITADPHTGGIPPGYPPPSSPKQGHCSGHQYIPICAARRKPLLVT